MGIMSISKTANGAASELIYFNVKMPTIDEINAATDEKIAAIASLICAAPTPTVLAYQEEAARRYRAEWMKLQPDYDKLNFWAAASRHMTCDLNKGCRKYIY